MVQVYKEPLCRRHYAGVLSPPACLRAGVLVGAVVLAFVLAFATGSFWRKVDWDLEQPAVHYTGDGIAVFEGATAGQEQVWASSPALQDLMGAKAAAVVVQVGELDPNQDGLPDVIHFRATLASTTPVYGFKLLLQFTYKLQRAARVRLYGLAYVQASSPLPGAAFSTDGQLVLLQTGPLTRATYSSAYNLPIISSQPAGATAATDTDGVLALPALLGRYAARNLTTAFEERYPVWTAAADSAGASDFELDVRIRVPPHQQLQYRPALGESLKWGWVQFLTTFAALWWLAGHFEAAVFGYRVLETRVVADVAPRAQNFS